MKESASRKPPSYVALRCNSIKIDWKRTLMSQCFTVSGENGTKALAENRTQTEQKLIIFCHTFTECWVLMKSRGYFFVCLWSNGTESRKKCKHKFVWIIWPGKCKANEEMNGRTFGSGISIFQRNSISNDGHPFTVFWFDAATELENDLAANL